MFGSIAEDGSLTKAAPWTVSRSDFDVPGLFLHACARADHSVSELIIRFKNPRQRASCSSQPASSQPANKQVAATERHVRGNAATWRPGGRASRG